MNIYVHTPREWYELYQLGKRMFGCFIGHTGHEVIENRFDDGDYSHFIEQPNVLRRYTEVHPDIKDHWIHESLENESGWFRYNKLEPLGRSPDFFVTDLDPEEALKVIDRTVERINNHFYEYETQTGQSPAKVRKFIKKRLQDYHRTPGSKLLESLYESNWKFYPRDARIAVARDAHGRICEFLLSKGFTNVTTDEEIKSLDQETLSKINMVSELTGKYDYVIGNPPYNNQMYREFLEKLPSLLHEGSEFSVLLPVFTFAKKKCIDVFKRDLKLTEVDMSGGYSFVNTIDGAWVTKFTGRLGQTDVFDIIFPDGQRLDNRSLDDVNPTGAKFIEMMARKKTVAPLLPEDYTIASKVMTGTAPVIKLKKQQLPQSYVFLSPVIHQMSAKSGGKYPGAFSLRGDVNTNEGQKSGYYVSSDNPELLHSIYCESKLFVYLYWSIITSSIYADGFITQLPDITNVQYNCDEDLYKHFNLTQSEIERVESIF